MPIVSLAVAPVPPVMVPPETETVPVPVAPDPASTPPLIATGPLPSVPVGFSARSVPPEIVVPPEKVPGAVIVTFPPVTPTDSMPPAPSATVPPLTLIAPGPANVAV